MSRYLTGEMSFGRLSKYLAGGVGLHVVMCMVISRMRARKVRNSPMEVWVYNAPNSVLLGGATYFVAISCVRQAYLSSVEVSGISPGK